VCTASSCKMRQMRKLDRAQTGLDEKTGKCKLVLAVILVVALATSAGAANLRTRHHKDRHVLS
jgi:hypothetical protein